MHTHHVDISIEDLEVTRLFNLSFVPRRAHESKVDHQSIHLRKERNKIHGSPCHYTILESNKNVLECPNDS